MLSAHWLVGRLHVGVQHGVFGVAKLFRLVSVECGEAVVTEVGDVGADADQEVYLQRWNDSVSSPV